MSEFSELFRRIDELESAKAVLISENQELAEHAEDTLLLSVIAEQISSVHTIDEVLGCGLERISILKDVPLGAYCVVDGQSLRVDSAFLSQGDQDLVGAVLALPASVLARVPIETVYLSGGDCDLISFPCPDGSTGFSARSALLIPLNANPENRQVMLFADSRDELRLPGLEVMLQRATSMLAVRMENLRLVESMSALNAELHATSEALAIATQAKSDFLANMSHEIRTPMNAILGFVQLLARDEDLTDLQRERLDIINRNSEHLLALLNDILEISKIEAGRSVLNVTTFDVRELLQDLLALFTYRAEAQGLQLSLECADDIPPTITGDKDKLRQVLLNLVSNALKFTSEGGITIRAWTVPCPDGTACLGFEVEDTGVGIAHDELDTLFAQFEQASAGRDSGTGTGLGLAISREYVRLMGGEITVRSQPGAGSAFRFVVFADIPAGPSNLTQASSATAVRLLGRGQRYRVLVADDFEEMRALVTAMLTELGFEVEAVADGAEAVRVFGEWAPDLIVMDMRMPVMAGPEAMKRIRAAEGGEQVKIVILTASAPDEDRNEAMARDADAFISKPFTQAQLLETLGSLLGAEFIREAATRKRSGTAPVPAREVPVELIDAMRAAARRADFDVILELATQIDAHDRDLAAEIRRLAEAYDAEGLLALRT